MPSQLIHLQIAADAVTDRRRPGDDLDGSFLLGTIAPDAWAVAGLNREATHFWDITRDASSPARLRAGHPQLDDPAALDPSARAFLAGYLCHLVTDEQWTFTIYRPYFGRLSAFQASAEGRRTQQAQQALLEQRLLDQRPADRRYWLDTLARTPAAISLPFLSAGAVETWRDLLLEACTLPTAAAAFQHVLTRIGQARDGHAGREAEQEAEREAEQWEWPELLRRVAAHVPEAALATFHHRAAGACAAILEEWLG